MILEKHPDHPEWVKRWRCLELGSLRKTRKRKEQRLGGVLNIYLSSSAATLHLFCSSFRPSSSKKDLGEFILKEILLFLVCTLHLGTFSYHFSPFNTSWYLNVICVVGMWRKMLAKCVAYYLPICNWYTIKLKWCTIPCIHVFDDKDTHRILIVNTKHLRIYVYVYICITYVCTLYLRDWRNGDVAATSLSFSFSRDTSF